MFRDMTYVVIVSPSGTPLMFVFVLEDHYWEQLCVSYTLGMDSRRGPGHDVPTSQRNDAPVADLRAYPGHILWSVVL